MFTNLKNRLTGLSLKLKVVIVVVLVIIGYLTYSHFFTNKSGAVQYQTSQAEKSTLVTSVSASGNITAGNSLPITTTATGIVTSVYVKNGDTVTQGEKIADINLDQSSTQRQTAAWASYLAAQNSLNSANANLNTLQTTLFVANQAFVNDTGVSNLTDTQKSNPKYIEENATWLAAEANYKNQQNVIAAAQAAVSNAWLNYQLASSSIVAPSAGIINNLAIAPGSVINSASNTSGSNATTSILTLGTIASDQGAVQAMVQVSEIDSPNVAQGQKVTMTLDAFPNKTFTGKVLLINTNGTVSSGVTSYPTTIVFDSAPTNIYSNMAVTAKIITSVKNDVLLVPTAAVQTTGGQSTVRVLKNDQVQSVSVEIGNSNETQTEITSGLSAGDVVVTGSTSTQPSTTTTSPFGGFGGGRGGATFIRGG